jgi:hypothetical protein
MRQKFLGSVPGGVPGNFQGPRSFWPHSVAMRSTQRLTGEYQGISLGIKCSRHVQLTFPPSCCAACQIKDGGPNFHPHSEPSLLVTEKLVILLFNTDVNVRMSSTELYTD